MSSPDHRASPLTCGPDHDPAGDDPGAAPGTRRRRWPSPDVLDELLVGRGKGADAAEDDLVIVPRPAPGDALETDDAPTDEEPRG